MREYDKIITIDKEEAKPCLQGRCYIFEKIDGANISIFFKDNDIVITSRHKILYKSGKIYDSFRGLINYILSQENILNMVKHNPYYIFYGEYLVKHTLKYPDNFMNKVWFFDIYDTLLRRYLYWEVIENIFEKFKVNYVPLLGIEYNPNINTLHNYLNINRFQASPKQEGIVIKNYFYINPYGRQQWVKMVNEEFKEVKTIKKDKKSIEEIIAEKFCVNNRVIKIYHNIMSEQIPLEKKIAKAINLVFYDILKEELPDLIIKKTPKIDFFKLKNLIANITKNIILDNNERR